jgi:hypothetical protein
MFLVWQFFVGNLLSVVLVLFPDIIIIIIIIILLQLVILITSTHIMVSWEWVERTGMKNMS